MTTITATSPPRMSSRSATRPSHHTFMLRRLVVLALAVLTVAVVLSGQAWADRPPAERAPVSSRALYVVEPGDTLWSIAERLDPSADPRAIVDRLERAAGGALLQAGQTIVLPPGIGA